MARAAAGASSRAHKRTAAAIASASGRNTARRLAGCQHASGSATSVALRPGHRDRHPSAGRPAVAAAPTRAPVTATAATSGAGRQMDSLLCPVPEPCGRVRAQNPVGERELLCIQPDTVATPLRNICAGILHTAALLRAPPVRRSAQELQDTHYCVAPGLVLWSGSAGPVPDDV